MEQFIKIFLPTYFTLYFLVTFVIPTLLVAKHTGQPVLVFPRDNSVEGLVGKYFKIALCSLCIYSFSYALIPGHSFFFIVHTKVQITGIMVLFAAFIISITAQCYMKNAWRIGIDKNVKTDLITHGIFSYSRNPVFFSMLLCLTGLILLTPNTFTVTIFPVVYILIQIQIRLEENFLTQAHGQKYLNYKIVTRRFI